MISYKTNEPFVKMKDTQKTFKQDDFEYEASHEVMNGQNVTTIKI